MHKDDVKYLHNVGNAVRDAARLVDAPANELNTEAMLQEAIAVAKDLGTTLTVVSVRLIFAIF